MKLTTTFKIRSDQPDEIEHNRLNVTKTLKDRQKLNLSWITTINVDNYISLTISKTCKVSDFCSIFRTSKNYRATCQIKTGPRVGHIPVHRLTPRIKSACASDLAFVRYPAKRALVHKGVFRFVCWRGGIKFESCRLQHTPGSRSWAASLLRPRYQSTTWASASSLAAR